MNCIESRDIRRYKNQEYKYVTREWWIGIQETCDFQRTEPTIDNKLGLIRIGMELVEPSFGRWYRETTDTRESHKLITLLAKLFFKWLSVVILHRFTRLLWEKKKYPKESRWVLSKNILYTIQRSHLIQRISNVLMCILSNSSVHFALSKNTLALMS